MRPGFWIALGVGSLDLWRLREGFVRTGEAREGKEGKLCVAVAARDKIGRAHV